MILRRINACLWAIVVLLTTYIVSAYVYNGHRFPGNVAYYYVNLESFRACLPNLNQATVLADLQLAASGWHDQTNADFSFVYLGPTTRTGLNNDGVTTVYCDATPNVEGLIAQTYWWYDGSGYLTNFDIAFYPNTYQQYPYLTSDLPCSAGLYLLDLAIHEWGHGLSLAHSSDSNATMWAPTSVCSTKERTLYSDDILAIETVYGVRTPAPDPPPPVIEPPPVTACVTNGVTYALGATLTQTMKNGQVGPWLTARELEGWGLLSTSKAKSLSTVTVECGS